MSSTTDAWEEARLIRRRRYQKQREQRASNHEAVAETSQAVPSNEAEPAAQGEENAQPSIDHDEDDVYRVTPEARERHVAKRRLEHLSRAATEPCFDDAEIFQCDTESGTARLILDLSVPGNLEYVSTYIMELEVTCVEWEALKLRIQVTSSRNITRATVEAWNRFWTLMGPYFQMPLTAEPEYSASTPPPQHQTLPGQARDGRPLIDVAQHLETLRIIHMEGSGYRDTSAVNVLIRQIDPRTPPAFDDRESEANLSEKENSEEEDPDVQEAILASMGIMREKETWGGQQPRNGRMESLEWEGRHGTPEDSEDPDVQEAILASVTTATENQTVEEEEQCDGRMGQEPTDETANNPEVQMELRWQKERMDGALQDALDARKAGSEGDTMRVDGDEMEYDGDVVKLYGTFSGLPRRRPLRPIVPGSHFADYHGEDTVLRSPRDRTHPQKAQESWQTRSPHRTEKRKSSAVGLSDQPVPVQTKRLRRNGSGSHITSSTASGAQVAVEDADGVTDGYQGRADRPAAAPEEASTFAEDGPVSAETAIMEEVVTSSDGAQGQPASTAAKAGSTLVDRDDTTMMHGIISSAGEVHPNIGETSSTATEYCVGSTRIGGTTAAIDDIAATNTTSLSNSSGENAAEENEGNAGDAASREMDGTERED